MIFSQLLIVLDESGLGPEELAPRLGVSNMTLRRWKKLRGDRNVPLLYRRTAVDAIYRLLIEGKLSASSPRVRALLDHAPPQSFEAAIKSLDVDTILSVDSGESNQDQLTLFLSKIGYRRERREEVDSSLSAMGRFKRFGEQWRLNISMLTKVIRSKEILSLDKLVAYGALFYLIYPFDLIPDSIPVVGYLDDFAMLSLAAAFYVRKFPNIFKQV